MVYVYRQWCKIQNTVNQFGLLDIFLLLWSVNYKQFFKIVLSKNVTDLPLSSPFSHLFVSGNMLLFICWSLKFVEWNLSGQAFGLKAYQKRMNYNTSSIRGDHQDELNTAKTSRMGKFCIKQKINAFEDAH